MRQTRLLDLIILFTTLFLNGGCKILPSESEYQTKYFIFTFLVEADSCSYGSDVPTSFGTIYPDDSPYVIKLDTKEEMAGLMTVTNYSDSSKVYINIIKTYKRKSINRDYIIESNEQIVIDMHF